MILIDLLSLCVWRENRQEMGEWLFPISPTPTFDQSELVQYIYNRRSVSAENAINPALIGCSFHEIFTE